MSRFSGIFLVVASVLASIILIVVGVFVGYHYDKDFTSYWSLSDKSSTLDAKSMYISEFVDKLNASRSSFSDYDAIFLKTPDNSFDKNFDALVTLRDRLVSISKMNESDFAYQTAIQQITAQEQGEAQNMLGVFEGCYYLRTFPILWGWILGVIVIMIIFFACLGIYHIASD